MYAQALTTGDGSAICGAVVISLRCDAVTLLNRICFEFFNKIIQPRILCCFLIHAVTFFPLR